MKILIVEDSKMFAGLICKKVSTDFSIQCVVASSYQEATSVLDDNTDQFSLAILDLNLPDAPDGEIVPYVTSKGIPAIVMTSQINDEIRDKIINMQLLDYILKGPSSMEVLANTIRRFFRNINFHILLVDDSDFSRGMMKKTLLSQHFKVMEASNGKEALECLSNHPSIRMVLTDYHMPEMDGFELIKEVRAKFSMEDIAIIGVSSRGNSLLASQFLKCGANDFLSKPFFDEEMIWRVNQNVEILDSVTKNRCYQEQLENEVQEQTAKIKESHVLLLQQEKLAAIGQLSAGVAHEINNPIAFISSNLSTLQNYIAKLMEFLDASCGDIETEELLQLRLKKKIDFIAEDINDLIMESTEGVERVKEIVKSLKQFARTGDLEAKESDVNEGLETTIKMVWNELKYKAKVIKEYGDLPTIKCFPQQLNQVFMNLLVNAAHAIEKEGEIIVKTWLDNKKVCVSVSDTGKGIAPENIKKLFDPFFTTKEVGKGTGLGLSISHEIIQNHKGTIDVKSEVGKGSTFTVTIPVSATA